MTVRTFLAALAVNSLFLVLCYLKAECGESQKCKLLYLEVSHYQVGHVCFDQYQLTS
jgi:hypothetical protein